MGRPGPKAEQLDDPVAEAKCQRKREQRMASYYKNHEVEKEKRRLKSAERRASRADGGRYEYERTHYLKYRYGITLEDYDQMLAEQGGRCGACGTTDVRNGKQRFDIDHDHVTGVVRGLLCGHCNRAFGMLADDVGRIEQLLMYALSHTGVAAATKEKE